MIITHPKDPALKCDIRPILYDNDVVLWGEVSHKNIADCVDVSGKMPEIPAAHSAILSAVYALFSEYIFQNSDALTEAGSPLGNKPAPVKEASIKLTTHTYLCLLIASLRVQEKEALQHDRTLIAMACSFLILRAELQQQKAFTYSEILTDDYAERCQRAWLVDVMPAGHTNFLEEAKSVLWHANEFVKEQMN